MKINKEWLPVKIHNFLFYAAMGPIISQIPVYGKELGISSIVMGTIITIVPIAAIVARPGVCILLDIYRDYRKSLFMLLLVVASASAAAVFFFPPWEEKTFTLKSIEAKSIRMCNETETLDQLHCNSNNYRVLCSSNCLQQSAGFLSEKTLQVCQITNNTFLSSFCTLKCQEDPAYSDHCLYVSAVFWGFIVLMTIATTLFFVINSLSDAICFDVIGNEGDFGRQKVWSVIGFGTIGFVSGYFIDNVSTNSTLINYTPALVILGIFSFLDVIICSKFELPDIEAPKSIKNDLKRLFKDPHIVVFMLFAVFAGVFDVLTNFFLLWYLEDFATRTNTQNIKLIEGLVIAAGNLGSEVLFFLISGKILKRFGHVTCFTLAFLSYSLRLWLIAVVPSPWWVIPIEFFLHGPSFAFAYTVIVEYANSVAPPGASATSQGVIAGIDDSLGFVCGSFIIGLSFEYLGTKGTFLAFSFFAAACGVIYNVLHRTVLRSYRSAGRITYEEIQ